MKGGEERTRREGREKGEEKERGRLWKRSKNRGGKGVEEKGGKGMELTWPLVLLCSQIIDPPLNPKWNTIQYVYLFRCL